MRFPRARFASRILAMFKSLSWVKVPRQYILFAKSNFRNAGDSLRGIVANPQVCPTISEITFGNLSSLILREWVHASTGRSAGSVGVPALRCFILPPPVSSFNFPSV